jgi:hypothetical protein
MAATIFATSGPVMSGGRPLAMAGDQAAAVTEFHWDA